MFSLKDRTVQYRLKVLKDNWTQFAEDVSSKTLTTPNHTFTQVISMANRMGVSMSHMPLRVSITTQR